MPELPENSASEAPVVAAATAFAAWLNGRGAGDASFLDERARVDRYGFADKAGRLVERLEGKAAVTEWAARTPADTRFEVVEVGGMARYRVEVAGFIGGGRWLITLNEKGRIAVLEHHPDDLDADLQREPMWREAVQMSLQAQDTAAADK